MPEAGNLKPQPLPLGELGAEVPAAPARYLRAGQHTQTGGRAGVRAGGSGKPGQAEQRSACPCSYSCPARARAAQGGGRERGSARPSRDPVRGRRRTHTTRPSRGLSSAPSPAEAGAGASLWPVTRRSWSHNYERLDFCC